MSPEDKFILIRHVSGYDSISVLTDLCLENDWAYHDRHTIECIETLPLIRLRDSDSKSKSKSLSNYTGHIFFRSTSTSSDRYNRSTTSPSTSSSTSSRSGYTDNCSSYTSLKDKYGKTVVRLI